jgi:hypothetical protein
MSRSLLPHRRLTAIDERLEDAAARPVIVPATIVVDQGSVFISRNFRSSCAWLGINFQPTHPGSPAEKPHVEKLTSSVGTLFAQFVSGYAGSNTERRCAPPVPSRQPAHHAGDAHRGHRAAAAGHCRPRLLPPPCGQGKTTMGGEPDEDAVSHRVLSSSNRVATVLRHVGFKDVVGFAGAVAAARLRTPSAL